MIKKYYIPNLIVTVAGLILLIAGTVQLTQGRKLNSDSKSEIGGGNIYIGILLLTIGNLIAGFVGFNIADSE